MKMLKKLAALILAATMVLVLFTACGGDTTSTPEAQAEAQMMSTINAKRGSAPQLCNDTELKQEAEKFLDSRVDINTGFLNFKNKIDVHHDGNGIFCAGIFESFEIIVRCVGKSVSHGTKSNLASVSRLACG